MRNLWIIQDKPFATWIADLSSVAHEPQLLLQWLRAVLVAGEEHEIFKLQTAPLIEYERNRAGALTDYLTRLYQDSGVIDLFHFASSGTGAIGDIRFKTFARLCYFDAQGQLTDSEVDDPGELLASLRPDKVAEAESAGLMMRLPPLEIIGPKIDYRQPERSVWTYKQGHLDVRFRIFSDIWFPWVLGFLEESFDVKRMYDNRLLAQRHTGRLNDFLAFVSESTTAIGGTWELDEEDSRTVSRFMLTPNGIRLDVEPPGGVMEYRK